MADIVERLRNHVNDRGGSSIANGAWEMMLEAASEIEHLRLEHQHACQEIGVAVQERDDARVLVETATDVMRRISDLPYFKNAPIETLVRAARDWLALTSTKSASADDTVALASPVREGGAQ